ncbi:MAG: NADPH2:quinone reductase [Halieaceae bacterium]|jgi:NADPH2:quinone reductase
MKAVFYQEHGPAEVLQVGELDIPEPGPDQVLVKIGATSINPIDRRLRAGELTEYITRTYPVVPGWDMAGRIVKLGVNVTDWQVGDDILGLAFTWSIQHGSYAEYAPIDVSAITRKPVQLSFEEASALPLVSLTAWQALIEFGELKPGQSVLIQAGAGGLGSIAIAIAKHLGARVYTTTRQVNFSYVKSLGADVLIDYTVEDYREVVRSHEPDGVDLVLESLLGGGIAEDAIRLAKDGGAVAYMNNEPPEMAEIDQRNIKAEFIHHRPDGAMLTELVALFEQGVLKVPEINIMQLDDAVEAHHQSEAGRTRGKIVLHIQDI